MKYALSSRCFKGIVYSAVLRQYLLTCSVAGANESRHVVPTNMNSYGIILSIGIRMIHFIEAG